MTTTSAIGSNTTTTTTTAPSSSGATGLTSSDFMKLMIDQLQHQDPLNPTDSNALLQQIAQISTLQSNQSLSTSLSSLTLQQSIGAGGNLIGKSVAGKTSGGDDIDGNVTGVQVKSDHVYLTLDNDPNKIIAMENVTDITNPLPAAAATPTTPTTPAAPTTPADPTRPTTPITPVSNPISDALDVVSAITG